MLLLKADMDIAVNKILESDEKDLAILTYLGRKVFRKTPDNKKQRQWWLANSDFTEHELDLIVSMSELFQPAVNFDKCRMHLDCYRSNSDAQIDGAGCPVTYSGLRNLVSKIRDSDGFWELCSNGYMSNQLANEILECDDSDPFILFYIGRKVFRKTPDNEQHRQWWLANSEFTEVDLDLVSNMTDLFRPVDVFDSDDYYRQHLENLYFSNSDDQIAGADSAVTYSGLRDLVKRIRGSAAFRESLGHLN
ncbi:uncharacterized protein LOC141704590 [Apium graveolens]|uniref:uncharacterized protein LOC141704590 n=1 Tax=Apium graveolens TaxID=4045 RepID=UPI003D79C40E